MYYEFQVLHTEFYQNVSKNELIQLVSKTLLQLLERLFLSRTSSSFHYSLDQSFFPKANFETSNKRRLYLLKLYLSNLTELL